MRSSLSALARSGSDDISFGDIQSFLRNRRRLVIASIVFFLVLATLYCIVATRRYAATGQLEIEKADTSSLSNLANADAAGNATDSLDYSTSQATQVDILQSDTLVLQVIRELDLEPTHDFFPKGIDSGTGLFGWMSPANASLEPMNVPLDQAPNRRAVALQKFNKRLAVKPIAGTRLISVTYFNPDPKIAAAVVNHLIAAYIDFAFEARLKETQQASQWLTSQLNELKAQTQGLEDKAIQLQRQTGLYGEDEAHNVVLSRLETLNAALTAAESNRILKGAIYKAVLNGNGEAISGLNGNSMNGNTPGNANSFALIQNLRAQEATLRGQLADFSTRYGADHPKIIQLRAQLNDVQQAIRQEDQRIADRAKSDYEIALTEEATNRKNLEDQKRTANDLNDKATEYALAKKEADSSRDLYGALLDKLKQAGVVEGLKASNVVIVDPAREPSSGDPAKPAIPLIYAIAIAAGIVLGGLLALLFELQSGKWFNPLSEFDGLRLLAVLPESTRQKGGLRRLVGLPPKLAADDGGLVDVKDADPMFVEGLLALRTAVLLPAGRSPKIITVTSPLYGDNKSLVSLNLAAMLARTGFKTLSISGDLRNPSPSGKGGALGLSELLTSSERYLPGSIPESRSNLYVLNGGTLPAALAAPDRLSSARLLELFEVWRNEFEFIVVDLPPVLPFADPLIVSQYADLVLLVTRQSMTTHNAFERAYTRLHDALPAETELGVVLTGVAEGSPEYGGYFGERSWNKISGGRSHA